MAEPKSLYCDYNQTRQKRLLDLTVRVVVALPKGAIKFGEALIKCNDGTTIKTKRP